MKKLLLSFFLLGLLSLNNCSKNDKIEVVKIENDQIKPFVDLSVFGEISSIRSSQGDVYFCDLSVQVIRGEVFTRMHEGMQPFQWMGNKSYPLLKGFAKAPFFFNLDR